MKNPCLLIVDVQQALIDGNPDDSLTFLERLSSLLASARASRVPIIYVQHSGPKGDELEPGTPGWALAEPVKPRLGEPVIAKRFNSSFKGTELESLLKDRGIDTLVIGGMQTEHCVDATIKSAFEKGFQVVVPERAHTTFRNGELSAAQVKDFYQNRIWKGRYASVEPVETVMKTLVNETQRTERHS